MSWKSCRPDILSISFNFLNSENRLVIMHKTTFPSKNCQRRLKFLNRNKYSNWPEYEKIKLKFCDIDFLTLFCIPETVDVVQSVRTSDCGSEGRGFEPHLPPENPGYSYKE